MPPPMMPIGRIEHPRQANVDRRDGDWVRQMRERLFVKFDGLRVGDVAAPAMGRRAWRTAPDSGGTATRRGRRQQRKRGRLGKRGRRAFLEGGDAMIYHSAFIGTARARRSSCNLCFHTSFPPSTHSFPFVTFHRTPRLPSPYRYPSSLPLQDCPSCSNHNFARRSTCHRCNSPRDP
jgi:hypothetical protein